MRGNCSPESTSMMRVPPIALVQATWPAGPALTVPIAVAPARSPAPPPPPVRRPTSFVGDVKRVEAEHLARRTYILAHRHSLFADFARKERFEFDFNKGSRAMDNSETFTSQPVNRRSFLKKGVLEAGAAGSERRPTGQCVSLWPRAR
jgi:hypothetical protein